MLGAMALGGCVEILDLGRFSIEGDAGQNAGPRDGGRDAGDRDAGRDACVPGTYYADRDGDGHGDPATAVEACAAPDGYVTTSDDCDDGDGAIRPGATETCDDADQDCDGAVDEGLIGPIGSPIDVVPDLGSAFWQGTLIAHQNGNVVVWRTDPEDIIKASFFGRNGAAVASDVMLQAIGTREPQAARFTRGGIDQIVVAWTDPTRIVARLCNGSGSCGSIRTVLEIDTDGHRDLRMTQLRDRLIVGWRSADGFLVVSFDPVTGDSSAPVLVPMAGDFTSFAGSIATVDGPEPYSLFGRVSVTLEGTTVTSSQAHLVRIYGDTSLTFDPTKMIEWDATARCSALGRTSCYPVLGISGEGVLERPTLTIGEYLIGVDPDGSRSTAQCIFIGRPTADGPSVSEECADDWGAAVLRGGVATVVKDVGADFVLREIPLLDGASGVPGVPLTPLSPTSSDLRSLAMRGAHGAVMVETRSTPNQLQILRIGCEP